MIHVRSEPLSVSVRKSNTRPTYILQAARLRYKDRASTPAWAEARAWISRSESCRAGFALETFEVLVLRRSDAERGLGYLGVENRELLVLLDSAIFPLAGQFVADRVRSNRR